MLFAHVVALISAMYALLFARIGLLHCSRPQLNYGPMSKWDEERQKNLDLIYNYNDVACVNMLHRRKAPFLGCATCLGREIYL
jgi:hypothetical protein